MADGGRKLVTLDDLIDALDKRERAPSNVPKVETFHFKGDRVSDWLDLTEQALVGLSDEVKLQRVLRYVLHSHHREATKVVDAAGGSWAKFGDLMRRKCRLGDDLLTMADLEAINKEDFSTIGAFVHEFKKRARKVHGISEEAQCATFLGLLTGSEATKLTKYGEGSERLTWATIDKGVEEGSLDQRAKKRGAPGGAKPSLHDGVPKRKKYVVRLEEGFDVERMVDKLLEGHNDLMNPKDILASAPRLHGELKGRLSRRLVPNVHLSSILPREIERTETGTRMDWKCVACGLVDLKVRDQPSIAMVDTGAKLNIIRERDATMLGLEVDHSDHGMLHGANCKAIFCGTTSNVMVEIGRVRARTCFFVMPDVDHPILLGRSFLCRTETLVFNRHEGTMILALSDPACGNYKIIKCRNTGPESARNRLNLGSFTFEESEYARRRLREEQEGEGAGEVLSLKLNDVNKAMEVVAAHDMADPETIKALREQVTAMHTPRGLIHMNVAPQGWTNAMAMVQRHMIRAMQTVSPHITQPYIDDLAVKGPKEKEEDEVMPGVTKSPDIEEPISAELPPVVSCASGGMEAEALTPGGQGPRVGGTPRETREEKSARVRVRLDEIHPRQAEMEAAGIEPAPPIEPKTSEQRIDELWARYESQRDAARQRSREAGRADEETSELREMGDLGFSATRQAIERMDRRGRGMRASPSQGAAVEVPRQNEPVEGVPLDTAGEEGGAQESLMVMSTERRVSRLHELAAAMGIGTPQERPKRLDAPEQAPRLGELRAELGSWVTETDSGGPDLRQQ
ncbi:hypothetical protein CBR_g48026 [Chara braunii]|uniref:Peptidase A2 domain-containing protein n=1 Tax=Chara braunii TaxID=69332 RepID=A0A388M1V0_CHABU|nr:hypothetical protein CBR_g48026 [Chara braunii]|eukprot:GBG88557.1 hypothetical protein CBR_g48026 [Chara braunii]